ncbi:hypothetical protein [Burkholderia multivorans]|uniref:hypothetical protein n=1 Tax=Burkholderia multivorans TaxID=87883 RepID=UPI0015E45BC1|nr:hypothetical protein [Burkholderia multivorans]MBR8240773.1 hypothetical protein [Burkholderia multivorans]MCL4660958.1 hypothetical protein [Burkholderia multivorans]MCO1352389.1 hypothetical protein [Burkholderia multivorans]MCO1413765.1 hypothetical protein [Burkholderia multivorans]MCO1446045.1 hypothetical protein [Burkholderia multivorans]
MADHSDIAKALDAFLKKHDLPLPGMAEAEDVAALAGLGAISTNRALDRAKQTRREGLHSRLAAQRQAMKMIRLRKEDESFRADTSFRESIVKFNKTYQSETWLDQRDFNSPFGRSVRHRKIQHDKFAARRRSCTGREV